MRKINLAKSAGYCFGVKRAVDMVYEEVKKNRNVVTYGPIIHNDEVVKDLENKGVRVVQSPEEFEGGTLIIRSHGVSREEYEALSEKEGRIIDATCPFVKKIHNIVRDFGEENRKVIVIGNADHPEVKGIVGWSKDGAAVIETKEDANNYKEDLFLKIGIVAQTTFNYKKFKELVEIISKKGYDVVAVNTICNATEERQNEAEELAGRSDAMIVVGGRSSSNTQKLYEICIAQCKHTYFIQTAEDLKDINLASFSCIGITAGASTPNNIIQEVLGNMSELSFEELLEDSVVTIHNGEVVEGKVISVKDSEIILNIRYKSDGILTKGEYSNNPDIDLKEEVKPGDLLNVKILRVNDGEGQVLLTYKRLQQDKINKRLREAMENSEVLTGKVSAVLGGGLSVNYDGTKVFIPASLISDIYEKDLSKYADKEIAFVLTEVNPQKRRIIGDSKRLIVAKKREMQKELFDKIEVGMIVQGIVKNLTDFGAFVDLGGADGLLHISEMSWGHIESPKKVFQVGDRVTVRIKGISDTKIALTMRMEENNPWTNASEKYQIGNIVVGKVARMTDFGAFVELEEGVDALLHVSQISVDHVEKPSDALKKGDSITAKIVDFNEAKKKISLSMKILELEERNKAVNEEEGENETEEIREESKEEVTEEVKEEVIDEVKEEVKEDSKEDMDEEIIEDNTDADEPEKM
ncbi:MAG: bifunctional 4-hydroxy-3-methylbut-2-enyl diphosphate reductase/30S ribosomal protein S1 [Lachnoclostridium sp.]|jgi:4-hydroxy-3-methylbut-2-enyl diphosphate reductase|nr:bifunctional 4-hydroxy-3-methylbut-2-enyl diphosphate reductase/30S ribosomal protein S1 [Lachnoclostridium sp.]